MSSTGRTGTDRLQMALRPRALALLAAVLFCLGPRTSSAASALIEAEVAVPWRAGNATLFQAGTREEGRVLSAQGMLSVRLYRPPGAERGAEPASRALTRASIRWKGEGQP